MEKSENLSASEPKYRLRRLTPTECLRLQGYADDWCDLEPIKDLTDEEIEFWEENRRYRAEMEGKRYKPMGKQGLIKWLNSLGSDSAIYKATGNSLAIPCAVEVIGRIARFVEQENENK